MERSVILLDNRHIEQLTQRAREAQISISWILRCLYFQHRDLAIRHRPVRPIGRLPAYCSPFPMCWHGDRSAVKRFLQVRELELSSVMRWLVARFLAGELRLDLGNEVWAKQENMPGDTRSELRNFGTRYRYQHQYKICKFKAREYWPINHLTLSAIREFGLNNRKNDRILGARPPLIRKKRANINL